MGGDVGFVFGGPNNPDPTIQHTNYATAQTTQIRNRRFYCIPFFFVPFHPKHPKHPFHPIHPTCFLNPTKPQRTRFLTYLTPIMYPIAFYFLWFLCIPHALHTLYRTKQRLYCSSMGNEPEPYWFTPYCISVYISYCIL